MKAACAKCVVTSFQAVLHAALQPVHYAPLVTISPHLTAYPVTPSPLIALPAQPQPVPLAPMATTSTTMPAHPVSPPTPTASAAATPPV